MVVKENCSEFFEFKQGGKKEKRSKICKNSAKCGKLVDFWENLLKITEKK